MGHFTSNLIIQMKTGVALTGSAAMGKIGPMIGLIDIAESTDSYYFHVSLPGVSRDENFSCVIEPDNKIVIKGITTGNREDSLQTQSGLPGNFTINFLLPGHVRTEEFNGTFGTDGVFEGLVEKLSYED